MERVDYKKLYTDIINKQNPEKITECEHLLNKEYLSVIDILIINKIIFGVNESKDFNLNQKFKSYTKQDIIQILDYQKIHSLNNTQLAKHFKISRNTIAKWRKIFI
ncbi:helix-turn-helix domain-containing protein [Empedobacter brevis]|uniref:Transposase n=2 Tax=Empedobacter brevis TaxID=247 RepID=A0A511NL31_9FLAO|nr:helix-turn-helix domain containing protein [Empedobacter brevis]MDM1071642.1 helix-turn-helix domain-containing protein [Empedobacter brevis]QES93995.1 helix-turn-helix domain-containing protein [Empedobacter brevis]QHC85808.1 transposase [Empedobacter brevis]GEM53504.1 hypothetical protein EB1_32940 [Empedobacter brevis NBRC 14943 = ATCC 43319]